jgi:hypothetical protein
MLYLAYATAIKTKTEYKKEFVEENIVISKEDQKLFDDMHAFFLKNPKTKEIFISTFHNHPKQSFHNHFQQIMKKAVTSQLPPYLERREIPLSYELPKRIQIN